MPSKRARSLIRATPSETPAEIPSFTVNHHSSETSEEQTQRQNNDDDFVYDSDEDQNINAPRIPARQTSSATGILAPIGLANQVTEIRAPVVLGNAVDNMAPVVLGNAVTNAMAPIGLAHAVTNATNTTAPIGLANQVTNTAVSLRAAADIMDQGILQMGRLRIQRGAITFEEI